MTASLSNLQASALPRTEAQPREAARLAYVDAFRGIVMCHMALDHVSMFFNRARFAKEVWGHRPDLPVSLAQFLTRFSGVFVAPAFSFMAGFMIALTTARRGARGITPAAIRRRLVERGVVLILAYALFVDLPMKRLSIGAVTSLGMSIIVVAFLERLGTWALAVIAGLVLTLHPLLDVSGLPPLLGRIVYGTEPLGILKVYFPLVPWVGIMIAGVVAGRLAAPHALHENARAWAWAALASFVLFWAVRLYGGYGNAFGYKHILSYEFFIWSKYPPDLPWLCWSFATIFGLLAVLAHVQRKTRWLDTRAGLFFRGIGGAPLFFYVLHFNVLVLLSVILPSWKHALGLPVVYLLWGLLCAGLYRPCVQFAIWKARYPSSPLRYF
jgi:uncharacterized membrane protein